MICCEAAVVQSLLFRYSFFFYRRGCWASFLRARILLGVRSGINVVERETIAPSSPLSFKGSRGLLLG